MNGLFHIYTGDGKGKTSAATGLAVRFAGSGGRVLYAQFLKKDDSSELCSMKQLENIELICCDKCFGFTFQMSEETKAEAKSFYTDYFQRIVKVIELKREPGEAEYGLLVLDELATAYATKMIEPEAVLNFIKNRPKELEIVVTGRNAAPELLELADYVSEIRKIKHPFDKGIGARKGIEM